MNFTSTKSSSAGPSINNITYLPGSEPLPTFEALAAPIDPDYRNLPIEEGFALETIVHRAADRYGHKKGQTYALVRFKSTRHPSKTKKQVLALAAKIKAADDAAYEEVRKLPGFIVYSPNGANETGEAVSWCLWQSWAEARMAHSLPAHQAAARRLKEFYQDHKVTFYDVHWLGKVDTEPHIELKEILPSERHHARAA